MPISTRKIKHFNPHKYPIFGIENRVTNQREFTVTFPTTNFLPYLRTDVVYDVHGKVYGVNHKFCSFFKPLNFLSDNTGKLVATITKWWTKPESEPQKLCCGYILPDLRTEPNAYVIDIINGCQLDANKKTALIGAALLIDFTYYLPRIQSQNNHNH